MNRFTRGQTAVRWILDQGSNFFPFYWHSLLAHLVSESFCWGGANKYWFLLPEIQVVQTENTSSWQREISQWPRFFCERWIPMPTSLMLTRSSSCSLGLWYDVSSQLKSKRIQNYMQDDAAMMVVVRSAQAAIPDGLHLLWAVGWRSCG